jgi:ubiquinone biosynthesis protein
MSQEFALLLRDSPAALRELSRIVKSGGIPISLKQANNSEMLSTSDRIANRLAFAFVLGACLVGSSIVASAKIPPTWNGISILGLGGFFVAMVMSAWLLVSILRSGKL